MARLPPGAGEIRVGLIRRRLFGGAGQTTMPLPLGLIGRQGLRRRWFGVRACFGPRFDRRRRAC
jgi:hypothetical protein